MDIGQRIKEIRISKGLSQRELGARMNVSQQMIGQYENSTAFPKIDTLKKLATALEIDTIELLNFEGAFFEKDDTVEGFLDWDAEYIRERFLRENELRLISPYRKLNSKGKEKAIEQVELLLKVTEFQAESDLKTDELDEEISKLIEHGQKTSKYSPKKF